jgi:hypothetical protein
MSFGYWLHLAQDRVQCQTREHGIEPYNSIKGVEFVTS